jgi:HEAT repeat protein
MLAATHSRVRSWTVALATLIAASAHGAQRPAAAPDLTVAEQSVVRALRATRAKPPPPVEQSRAAVVKQARAVVPLLIVMLDERKVPGVDGLASQRLSIAQSELIHAGLRVAGRREALAALDRRLAGSSETSTRAAAIEVYGLFGEAKDLRTIVQLAGGAADGELDARIDTTLQQAIAAVLGRDERAFDALSAVARDRSRSVLASMLFGVGAARDARGLSFVADVLAWHAELAVEGLSQIRLMGRSPSPEVDERLAEFARESLDLTREARCRAATVALGALEDPHALPALIDLLESHSSGMRDDAAWALRRISGQDFQLARDDWALWYGDERRWYDEQMGEQSAALGTDDLAQFAAAVQVLSRHFLYRHEVAEALLPSLNRTEPQLRCVVCAALGELGSTVAVRALTETVGDEDDSVSACARAALRAITGRDPLAADDRQ